MSDAKQFNYYFLEYIGPFLFGSMLGASTIHHWWGFFVGGIIVTTTWRLTDYLTDKDWF